MKITFLGFPARRGEMLDAATAERHRVPPRQLDLAQVRVSRAESIK